MSLNVYKPSGKDTSDPLITFFTVSSLSPSSFILSFLKTSCTSSTCWPAIWTDATPSSPFNPGTTFFSTFSVKVAKDSFLLATLNEITGKALKFTRETLGSLTPSGSFTFVRASLISVSAFSIFLSKSYST
ncbi:Uncharacterised protein [Streptococcus pneumoniae]|nr:Uncharacterised protein [Streptococcus pneumoniae]